VRVLLDDTWISLWISSDSSLLGAAEYRTELPGRGDVTARWEWRGWRRDSTGAVRPSGHRIVIDGRVFQSVEYRRFQIAGPAADSLLRIPNEIRSRRRPMTMNAPATGDSALPSSGEVAPGVHVLSVGGFNVFIVEFAEFVLLVEAPSAAPGFEAIPATRAPDRIAGELIARIREIARGRPLGYTVITHTHSDHIGNAAALGSLTRTFLVPADARDLMRRQNIEVVRGERTVRDSTRRVVIYDVGANPHTAHNLFVWLPRERIGFQGDLFYYDQGDADIPADRAPISVFFAKWLHAKGLSPRAVYGVHNDGAAGPAILERAFSR
jgi:glyoxylase-like metal-dependent hydrolase (beta-lactamase superfamily II)